MHRTLRLVLALVGQLLLVSAASAQSVFLSELADPRLNYQTDRFIEIYNPGPGATDLSGWRIVAIANNVDVFTWNLSGTIQPGEALVAGDQTLTVSFPVDFPAEAWSASNGNWNGRVGDGAKLINASSQIVDLVVALNVDFENLDLVRNASVTGPSATYVPSQWTGTPIDFPTQGTPGTHGGSVSFPVIGSIQTTPTTPSAGQAVAVSATITDAGATLTSAELRWGTASNALANTIPMSAVGGDTWSTDASIPGQTAGTTVYFEIEAFNDVPVSTTSTLQSYALAAFTSIFDIQGQQSSSPLAGTSVLTQGVVTAVLPGFFVVQDGTGPWSGLWVASNDVPALGDLVELQGQVTETYGNGFSGTTLLADAVILSTSAGSLPAPATLDAASAFGEAQEGVLVQVLDATCTNPQLGGGTWLVDDGTGSGRVFELGYDSTPYLGTRYDLVGAVRFDGTAFGLEPRSAADVLFAGDSFAPQITSVELVDLTTLRVTFTEPVDATSAAVAAHYAIAGITVSGAVRDGVDPTKVTLTTSEFSTGNYTLVVTGVEDLFGNATAGASKLFAANAYSPPPGYYDTAFGLTGTPLRAALHAIIDDHNVVSYSGTLSVFFTSDDKPNGKVWDMYSDTPGSTPPYEYTFGVDSGASAASEGQGYNREHSWPRSWFGGDVAPMNSDLFQLYPTDIYVNSIRGNLPYGEVGVPDYTSLNGSKRGPNTYPGYSGQVFEPIDAYKGDFARSYFYMVARYYTEDGAWPGSEMTSGADLLSWAEAMLYEWHVADPVSTKERERNHVVYGFQGNRNPFIDHPEFAGAMFEISTPVFGEPSSSFSLRANSPNPFSSTTSIAFELSRPEVVTLTVYDLRGREVRRLVDGRRDAGSHVLHWDGRDARDQDVAAGTYFYRLRVGDAVQTKRMSLVR